MEVLKNVPAIGNLIALETGNRSTRLWKPSPRKGCLLWSNIYYSLHQHGIISRESAIAYANDASLIERLGG